MLELRPYQAECLTALKARLRETETPLLVNASVGAGKSLIIAELLLVIERAGWRALCLTMNSTLIKQNAETYKNQGGHPGIYCAALGEKETASPIIFASPQSVINSIEKKTGLHSVPFNLIVIDECHNINIHNTQATYTKILNWYSAQGNRFRIVGLTGTPYRGKGVSIVKSQTNQAGWMEEVCSIDASWLIKNGYLVQPHWGCSKEKLKYDFDDLKTNSMGKFDSKQIKERLCVKPRLTALIMQEVQEIVSQRRGAFIFATSIEHCKECMAWLPDNESAMITGDTPDDLRQEYITKARLGEIKYLVNVNVLCTGVDVPLFDTVVFVRPTESLVLYMQAIGRGLRLHPEKQSCLILDYAGNLERHGDIDNPIINVAIKNQSRDDPDYCIPCYQCETLNKVTARRCIGTVDDKRCDHYFDFKECLVCKCLNDITARYCRECKVEILDPNRNLKIEADKLEGSFYKVIDTYYKAETRGQGTFFRASYKLKNEKRIIVANERYATWTKKSQNYFYFNFVKEQFIDPGKAYNRLDDADYLNSCEKLDPSYIIAAKIDKNNYKIIKKLFKEPTPEEHQSTHKPCQQHPAPQSTRKRSTRPLPFYL